MMDMGFGFGSYWMLLGPLVWVAVPALVVAGVWRAMNGRTKADSTPLDVLKQRFARGEIDEAAYVEARKLLES